MSNQPNNVVDYLGAVRSAQEASDNDVYSSDVYHAFGYIRKPVADEPMIRFIRSDGSQVAIAYSHLYSLAMDASKGIIAEFTEHTVEIKGRGLTEGFERLSSHRVNFVCEADRPTGALLADGAPVVAELIITHRKHV